MKRIVSKSEFKPKVFEYFRLVQKSNRPLYITDHGKTVLKIIPCREDEGELLKELRGTIIKYENPCLPVGIEDWEELE